MRTYYNINIIVQTTGGYAYYFNGKRENPNKTLTNITRNILLKSSQKKELWCFAYKYAIWISRRTENILCGDFTYFLQNGTRTSYKHIKIWGARVYIINGRDTRNKLDDISYRGYFMIYSSTKGVILY